MKIPNPVMAKSWDEFLELEYHQRMEQRRIWIEWQGANTKSHNELADKLGMSHSQLTRVVNTVKADVQNASNSTGRPVDQDRLERYRKYCDEGLTVRQVAEREGVTVHVVYDYANRHDIPLRRKRGYLSRGKKKPPEAKAAPRQPSLPETPLDRMKRMARAESGATLKRGGVG